MSSDKVERGSEVRGDVSPEIWLFLYDYNSASRAGTLDDDALRGALRDFLGGFQLILI